MRDRTRTAIAVIVGLALVVGVTAGCQPTTGGGGGTKAEPIKIGAVLSLTGAQAGLGKPEKDVIDMEVPLINAAGGVNGRKIEVISLDDASDVDKAVTVTTRLIEKDKVVAIIGSTGTGQTMQMRGVIDKAKIPQVSMAGSMIITKQFDPLVFQTPWPNTLVVPATLKYLQSKGYKKIGLITEDTTFGKDGRQLVNEQAATYGMTVVGDEVFKPTDTDMSAQLTVLNGKKPDVIVQWSSTGASAIVPKNMQQLKMKMPLIGSHGVASSSFLAGAGDAANGMTIFAGKVLAPEAYGTGTAGFTLANDFISRYTKKYGEPPANTFAGHAYDALHIVVNAMKAAPEDFTPAQLRDAIEKTKDFQGIGGVFTFSPTDHNGLTESDLVRYTATDGKWVLAK